jgi:hypothetical protein
VSVFMKSAVFIKTDVSVFMKSTVFANI